MIETKPIIDKKIWETFVLSQAQAGFLQSWNWGQFHQSLNHDIFRLGVYQNHRLIGVALLIKIKSKRGIYLECPGGPIIPWENQLVRQAIVTSFKSLAKKVKANFIRIRPNILATSEHLNLIQNLGFIKAPMHLHAETTWVLNLQDSEAELLKNMRKNTRYSIKKALSLGVKVIKSLDVQDIKTLYQLQLETVKRKKFVPFSYHYLLAQFNTFKQDNQIQLFKADFNGKTLAIAFIIFYAHEAVYHYSGSSNQFRHIPASYLLQWEAIKAAKSRGLAQYNFWGIADTDNPKHRFAGVTLFKKGFGGFPVNFLPAHDLPLTPLYWLDYLFETFRRKFRHL